MYGSLIAALLIALFFTLVSVILFRRKGPWGTAWTFFLIMFLALWTVSLYVRTAGPLYWGIAWLPLMFAGLLLATLMLAIVPVIQNDELLRETDSGRPRPPRPVSYTPPGKLFWILIALLITAILLGMISRE